jgi:hypothetical protein
MSDAADRWYLSGPLGIGIIQPHGKLDVDGEIVTTKRLTLAQDSGSATRTWHLDNANGALRIFDQPNIDAPGTERLTIHPDGKVGITGEAVIGGKASITGGAVIAGVTIGSDAPGIDYPFQYETIGVAQSNMNLRLQSPNAIVVHTGRTERLIITADGSVGIGSTAPRRKLYVLGEIVATNRLTLAQDGGSATRTWHLANSANRLVIFDQPNINTNGTERLTIAPDGNVGIGTATPGARLDVSGSGGVSQCCAPRPPTISLAENPQVAGRQAWLQFHNAFEAEAYIRLAGGGPSGSGRDGGRRLEIGDNQGQNTGLWVAGEIYANGNVNPLRLTSAWTGFPDAANNRAEISNDTGGYKTLMIAGNRSAGVGRRVSVWDRLEVNGTFAIIGLTRDDLARQILDTLPLPYSVIIGVEDRSQGTSLVFYWRDGNGQRKKGWISGWAF